jgi:protocatechuate 3,4-dioxygenase beta subunit
MHSDDEPVGRVLNRRNALALLGLVGVAATAAAGTGIASAGTSSPTKGTAGGVDCVAKPEMTEGPYFLDEMLNRSDIRVEPSDGSRVAGTALGLNLTVMQITDGRCTPLPDATVDIWQCDALGVYSGIEQQDTVGKQFLRGYQVSDRAGRTRFTTILPGWYQGRTVHTHVKIQTVGTDGNAYEFTSQLYLPEDFTTAYLATAPYASKGTPDTVNSTDMHYANGGDQMLLRPTRQGRGWAANFTIALDLSDTEVGADDSFEMPGGGDPGGEPPASPPA